MITKMRQRSKKREETEIRGREKGKEGLGRERKPPLRKQYSLRTQEMAQIKRNK